MQLSSLLDLNKIRRARADMHDAKSIQISSYVDDQNVFIFITNLNAENVRLEIKGPIHRIRISLYIDNWNAFVFITNLNAENVC